MRNLDAAARREFPSSWWLGIPGSESHQKSTQLLQNNELRTGRPLNGALPLPPRGLHFPPSGAEETLGLWQVSFKKAEKKASLETPAPLHPAPSECPARVLLQKRGTAAQDMMTAQCLPLRPDHCILTGLREPPFPGTNRNSSKNSTPWVSSMDVSPGSSKISSLSYVNMLGIRFSQWMFDLP